MSFSIARKLPPTLVTRDLIEVIEKIIQKFILDSVGDNEELKTELVKKISIIIRDDQGEEIISSISEMHGKKFHDSTNRVSLRFSALFGTPLERNEIEVSFFTRPSLSEVVVRCGGKNSRNISVGIADSIIRAVETSPNGHAFFHASPLRSGLVITLLVILIYFLHYFGRIGVAVHLTASAMLLVAQIGYYFSGFFVFNYCSFDSSAHVKRTQWKEWLIKAALGFLIFGTALALVKDYAFNYLGLTGP